MWSKFMSNILNFLQTLHNYSIFWAEMLWHLIFMLYWSIFSQNINILYNILVHSVWGYIIDALCYDCNFILVLNNKISKSYNIWLSMSILFFKSQILRCLQFLALNMYCILRSNPKHLNVSFLNKTALTQSVQLSIHQWV